MQISNEGIVKSFQTLLDKDVTANKADGINKTDAFDAILKTKLSTFTSVNSSNPQDVISEEDAKYLVLENVPGGVDVHFPADSAPIETKRAWIEAMKKLPVDKQMGIKLSIIVDAGLETKQNIANLDYSKLQKYLSGITSYQDVLYKIIGDLKKSTSTDDKYAPRDLTQQSIDACKVVIDTFAKYNIK